MDVSPERRPRRAARIFLLGLFGLAVYLGAESFQPPGRQPSARLAAWAIDAYQSGGSPVARWLGFRCRYRPSCSHYAEEAVERFGTLRGAALAAGRWWRCSPWGGAGYDPVPAP